MPTVLYTHPICLEHDTGEYHPECADRLRVISRILEHEDFYYLLRAEAPEASLEQLLRVHSQDHIDRVMALLPHDDGVREVDQDTFVSRHSGDAALRAAGAVCAAVDDVTAGTCRNAFCAVRPPGHHAEPEAAMGFCLFSNAAIGAFHARVKHGFRRVAVIDFDVHHGNGTQAAFWTQPGMFYGSTHQADAYPYSGLEDERGAEGGGTVVNVPLKSYTGSQAFRAAYDEVILPRLRAFAPDFLILSAGFDGHVADPVANLGLHVNDFEWLTRQLVAIAGAFSENRLVSVLEGGYDPRALAACVAAHIRVLMGG